jgi:SAM-dependent methyltransferase
MQAYSAAFAQVYNLRWRGFAQHVAPLIIDFYAATPIGQVKKTVLDVCCGTGQLALHFLEAGYQVTGLDLSEPMLHYAQENTSRFVATGQARFIHADAAHFSLDDHFGLVVSTFDALNHLPDEAALRNCFRCVFSVLEANGLFVFDLNTAVGLRRWNAISMDDSSDEILLINRGIFDEEGDKAWTRITGFVRTLAGTYTRFDETVFNTIFNLEFVQAALLEIGWQEVYCARVEALKIPLTTPEAESRVFIVAHK